MGKRKTRQVAMIPIANPLAGHRLTKKIGGIIQKSCESKDLIYGVKDTVKALRKPFKGLCVIGGNVSPMDVISHIPALCDENKVPYVFLPTKEQISAYANRTSPVACVMVKKQEAEDFGEVLAEISQLLCPTEAENNDNE